MDYKRLSFNALKLNFWNEWRKIYYFDQKQVVEEQMSYNVSMQQTPHLVMDLERLQNRYLLLGNKGMSFIDTHDLAHPDATLLPDHLNPRRGVISDISWFPSDNSLSATVHTTGNVDLIDMNNMDIVESFDLKVPSHCLSFDISGAFPFSIAVGNRIGVRICDIKSGTMIQLLQSKHDATCLARNKTHPQQLISGHSDGTICTWDLRQAVKPMYSINLGSSSIRQILVKQASSGYIYAGSVNGTLSAINNSAVVWSALTETSGPGSKMFCMSHLGDLIVPENGLIRFVDAFSGDLLHSSVQTCLQEPLNIIQNDFNKDFIVSDRHYIGQIYKFRSKCRFNKDEDE